MLADAGHRALADYSKALNAFCLAHPALYAPQSFAWTVQDANTGVLGFTLQAGCETLLCALNTGTQAVQGVWAKAGLGQLCPAAVCRGLGGSCSLPHCQRMAGAGPCTVKRRNLADRVVFRLDKPAFPAILRIGHKNRGAGGHLRLRSKQLCFEHPIPDPGNAGVGSFAAVIYCSQRFLAPAVPAGVFLVFMYYFSGVVCICHPLTPKRALW